MAALRKLLLLCLVAASLADGALPSDGSAMALAADAAAPCAAGAAGCEAEGAGEEEPGLDQHVLLLQTGLQLGGGGRVHGGAPPAAEPPDPVASEAAAPGSEALAALARADALARPAAAAGDSCEVTGSGNVTTKALEVLGKWTGVLAQKVQVQVVAATGEPSVHITAYSNLLPKVRAYVSYFGTLVLDMEPGACNLNVVVTLTRPDPLTHLIATAGAKASAESVGGPISASNHGQITAHYVNGSSVSIDASDYAAITLAEGHVGSLTVSSSSAAVVSLGTITAEFASLTASSAAKLYAPASVQLASISASSGAVLTANVAGSAGLSCSSGAAVNITGLGEITPWSTVGCDYHKL